MDNAEHFCTPQRSKIGETTMSVNLYDQQTAKMVAMIATRMPRCMDADDMQGWLQNPEALSHALERALCPVENMDFKPRDLKPWRTMKVGTSVMKSELYFYQMLEEEGRLPKGQRHIYDKFRFRVVPEQEIELFRVSLGAIGFPHGATRHNIQKRIGQLGFNICAPEVAPRLCREYFTDKSEVIRVAMEPLREEGGKGSAIFGLLQNFNSKKGCELDLVEGGMYHYFANDGTWVFQRPVGVSVPRRFI